VNCPHGRLSVAQYSTPGSAVASPCYTGSGKRCLVTLDVPFEDALYHVALSGPNLSGRVRPEIVFRISVVAQCLSRFEMLV